MNYRQLLLLLFCLGWVRWEGRELKKLVVQVEPEEAMMDELTKEEEKRDE